MFVKESKTRLGIERAEDTIESESKPVHIPREVNVDLNSVIEDLLENRERRNLKVLSLHDEESVLAPGEELPDADIEISKYLTEDDQEVRTNWWQDISHYFDFSHTDKEEQAELLFEKAVEESPHWWNKLLGDSNHRNDAVFVDGG